MTTSSFPVGEQNFTTAQWRKANGASDGIADCDGTSATDLRLTLSPTTDVATVGTGVVRFENFALQVTAGHGLTLAPAVGVAKTYCVGVMHNPALETDPLGPLRLAAPPKTALGIPSGGAFLPLYEVTRSPSQVLSQASVVDQRSYAGDLLAGTPNTAAALAAPLGSRLWTGTEDLVRVHNSARTGAVWQSLTDPPWLPLSTGFSGGWGQYASAPARYRVRPGWVDLVGGVRLGARPASYTVLQLPASCWPRELRFAGGHRSSGGAKGIPFEVLVDKTGHLIIDPVWAADVIEDALTPSVVYPVSGSYPL